MCYVESPLPRRPHLLSFTESEGDSDTDLEIAEEEKRIVAVSGGGASGEVTYHVTDKKVGAIS